MRTIRSFEILLAIALAAPFLASGQGRAGRGGRGAAGAAAPDTFYNFDPAASSAKAISDAAPVETHQKITIDGQPLAYTARAGFLPLRNATSGQTEAHIFFTAYSKDGASGMAARPIVFFLGGAPGVSSAWQEFSGLGPKRINSGAGGGWVDNTGTLLADADLVFVNPVGTAFSRADQPGRAASFWNSAADVASLADFVRTFVRAGNRGNSPLFLAADDFGSGRAAGLAAYLTEHDIPVRGVALLSMTLSADSQAGDAEYINLLPSMVMAAWRHKKLSPELNAMAAEQIAGQARQLASREYLHALYKGDRMTAEERAQIASDLAKYTGLPKPFLISNDLRVSLDRFAGELLHDKHETLSRSDARVAGFAPTPAGFGRGGGGGRGAPAAAPIDFNLSALAPPFLSGYENYLAHELNFNASADAVYYLMSGGVGAFTSTGNDDASLANAFARNPNMHLFVAVNYYDLDAPFYATEFTLAHLNVSSEVRAHNIAISHYEAGQMTYADDKALGKLQKDLANFIGDATRK